MVIQGPPNAKKPPGIFRPSKLPALAGGGGEHSGPAGPAGLGQGTGIQPINPTPPPVDYASLIKNNPDYTLGMEAIGRQYGRDLFRVRHAFEQNSANDINSANASGNLFSGARAAHQAYIDSQSKRQNDELEQDRLASENQLTRNVGKSLLAGTSPILVGV